MTVLLRRPITVAGQQVTAAQITEDNGILADKYGLLAKPVTVGENAAAENAVGDQI